MAVLASLDLWVGDAGLGVTRSAGGLSITDGCLDRELGKPTGLFKKLSLAGSYFDLTPAFDFALRRASNSFACEQLRREPSRDKFESRCAERCPYRRVVENVFDAREAQAGIFVVARDTVSRLGLITIVEDDPHLDLVGSASSLDQPLSALTDGTVQVLVVAIRVGDTSGYELTAALREQDVHVPILLVSDEPTGDDVIKALGSGATGIVTAAESTELVDAIRKTANGQSVVGSDAGAVLVPELRRRAHATYTLTERELNILNELATGGTAAEIAARMCLATPTVKNHVAHIYAKLGVRDRGAAVAEAMRQGWLQ